LHFAYGVFCWICWLILSLASSGWGFWGGGRPTPKESEKGFLSQWQKYFIPYVHLNDVRCIFEINVGLLSSADNSVTVSPGGGGWFQGG